MADNARWIIAACELYRATRKSEYESQAFRLGRAYGFQFHVEVDGALLSAWARHLPLPDDAREWLRSTDAERRGILARWVRQALDAVP